MDGTLPSYEAAMRDAREYLRRRDLTSQDEVPLYFAWERLYAAANVNLSTDFLNETRAELRARQQARLTPRQGLPPPLFTSFDKLNRKSMQSSAFLRSGLSSDAAIEMMARRYRREAEKLRSSRDKLVMSSVGDTGKRVKKCKRGKKTPQEEVDDLLEDLERPSSPERRGFKTTEGGTRTKKKFNRRQQNPEREVEELLAKLKFENSKVLPESKMRAARTATNKDEFDFAGGKDSFAEELVGGDKAAKAAELRRSSFSMGNTAIDPVLADVENVAAFAAQVSNWRMYPTADTEVKLSQNGTKGTKRVNGANKLKKSAGGEGEADTTFDTALWSSGSAEGPFETNGSLRSSAVSTSPTSRRSTAHTSEWADDDDDNLGVDEAQLAARDEELHDQPAVGVPNSNSVSSQPGKKSSIASSSAVEQNLQLSHAVGEMQVKIKGKEIQVTFKGSLDDGNSDGINNAGLHSERIQRIAKTSATQKVFGIADTTKLRDGGKGDEHGTAEQPAQMPNAAQDDVHLPHKQSSVRFYGVEDDDVDEDTNEGRVSSDHETSQIESEVCGTTVASEPTRHEKHSYQALSATQSTAEEESLYHDAFSDEKTTQQIEREVVYEANSDDANGGLRTSASQVERSTVRGHRREESAQRSEVDPAVSSDSVPTKSKNNDRLEPFIPSNAATKNTAEDDSLYSDVSRGEAVELENAKDPNKSRRQQGEREEVRETSEQDSGELRASSSDQLRTVSQVEVSSAVDSAQRLQARDKHGTRTHSSRRSRNQQLVVEDSDEDFSDGPDTPDIEYHRHTTSRYESSQLLRRIPRDTREYAEYEHRERHSSRPSTRPTSSRHKQRNQSPDSSNDSSYSETQKTHGRHRSDSAERPRPSHSNRDRHGHRRSSRYPAYDLRDRDHHLAAAMESPPKRSKSDIRTKEMKLTKAKHDSRSSKPTSRSLKLPEGIVWPPGMEADCIARLGLDGHHPIAPPGLEHLVTDEQWGDYWTWLHWYSSWQMWYMKNDKKPRRNSDKKKRGGRRHSESDESPDNEADHYEKHAARNANWWLDVSATKHRRRRSRSD
ncbi:hypothetical protein PF005_g20856 [Phytophthora fragariae]|uniref:Uncharacterized protein n=1 Tax=Phytophthora fragariae TaxID=53985 RepID=A0A6A3XK45_9STRA|nr:hypothetical protein PF009_g21845 [Phytophthora fragariae]KAE8987109.1 hypothetical protein PF011_g19707 [Phytophthora fragariae]KAE9085884.1 hypothetical protein PF010_g20299 [Phytophthora fragariae]KAE9086038.1 hypothetical protein PF007_g20923 [Phytophthora fragariae]KAE9113146.1 hypothetical protein PF006_g19822 [Phytophthora fragariae]